MLSMIQSEDIAIMNEWESKFKRIDANTNDINIFSKYL